MARVDLNVARCVSASSRDAKSALPTALGHLVGLEASIVRVSELINGDPLLLVLALKLKRYDNQISRCATNNN